MKTTGFTLVELIVVILLVGILSVSAIPRFFSDDGFKARGVADEIITSIRHAQRLAMTRGVQHRIDIAPNKYHVCRSNGGDCSTVPLDYEVRHPNGQNKYLIDANKGLPANLISSTEYVEFNTLGQPVDAAGVLIPNDTDIVITPFTVRIEEETGYAHLR